MAAVQMTASERAAVRDLLERAVDAIDRGVIVDHDDVGLVARAMMRLVDADEFKEGLCGETANGLLDRLLAMSIVG